ncbi:Uncharacterised protein [Enterobacter hormaechei]|nr:Uncharacterised protein [Enterobacter hormaechei]
MKVHATIFGSVSPSLVPFTAFMFAAGDPCYKRPVFVYLDRLHFLIDIRIGERTEAIP